MGKVRGTQVKGKIYKMVKSQSSMELLDLTQEDTTVPEMKQYGREEILEHIKNSDLMGLSGDGFSTYQKIATVLASTQPVKYFIINAVECDPGLLHDEWLLHNKKKEIKMGAEKLLIKQVLGQELKAEDIPAKRES